MNATPAPQQSLVRSVFRVMLGVLLVLTGTSHLTVARKTFQAQVPDWVPLDKDLVVLLSGLVELALGSALALPHRRHTLVGWIAAAFFTAIFPGNLNQYQKGIDAFGLNSDALRFVRLLLHPLLVAWPLWSTGAWQSWRNGKN